MHSHELAGGPCRTLNSNSSHKLFDYPLFICYNVIMKIMRFCRFLEE